MLQNMRNSENISNIALGPCDNNNIYAIVVVLGILFWQDVNFLVLSSSPITKHLKIEKMNFVSKSQG